MLTKVHGAASSAFSGRIRESMMKIRRLTLGFITWIENSGFQCSRHINGLNFVKRIPPLKSFFPSALRQAESIQLAEEVV